MAEVNNSKNDQYEEEENEGEYIPNLKEYNVNNVIDNINNNNPNVNLQENNLNNNLNNQRNPRPSFVESTTQKVSDIIDQINTIPEADLQSWNLVADYTP